MIYEKLISKVFYEGIEELNQRTGLKTKRLLAQTVELEDKWIFSPRKFSTRIAAAECAWQLSGLQSTEWLDKQTSIWKKFERPDGFIETAYGFRWRSSFGRDQIAEAIELLRKDPSSRQNLVISWDPRMDGLANQGRQLNVPCPFAISFYVVDGVGRSVIYQRSADIIIGIPYDLLDYYLVSQAVFNSAEIPFKGLSILIGDAHIYENLYEVAKKMLNYKSPDHSHKLGHSWTVEQIVADPDRFVAGFAGAYDGVDWPMAEKLEATL